MIQRIQSVYILVVIILISLLYFLPFSSFTIEQDMSVYHLSIKGLIPDVGEQKSLLRVIPLLILIPSISLLTIFSIFIFKRRMLQIRLCIVNIVLLVGLQGFLFYFVSVASHQLGGKTSYSLIFVFPVISAVITYLAIRRIAKDEALVRSLDRLR